MYVCVSSVVVQQTRLTHSLTIAFIPASASVILALHSVCLSGSGVTCVQTMADELLFGPAQHTPHL